MKHRFPHVLAAVAFVVAPLVGMGCADRWHAQPHPEPVTTTTTTTVAPTTTTVPTVTVFMAPHETTEDSADTLDALHKCWAVGTLECDVVGNGDGVLSVIGYPYPLP